jgi:hypothetical protein
LGDDDVESELHPKVQTTERTMGQRGVTAARLARRDATVT